MHLLHDSYGFKGTCVCQTIRRRANVDILTRYVRVVLEPIQYAIYWGHRGFWWARNSFFSADGVHLKVGGDISYIAAFGKRYSNLFEFLLAMAICHFLSLPFLSMECYAVLLIPILFVSSFGFFILVAAVYLRAALPACQPLILLLVVAAYLCTTLTACQPFILMFSRCVFARGTGCVPAFHFTV